MRKRVAVAVIAMMMMMVTTVMEMDVRYEVVLAYAAHDGLPHLLPLAPYSLGDADGDRDDHASHQQEEGGVNVGKPRAVKGRRCRAPRHLRQHPFLYLVQDAAFVRTQDAATDLGSYKRKSARERFSRSE